MAVIDKREFKRGDIYWFDYEYTDENGVRQQSNRPGIIVSNDAHNERALDLEIVWLTTATKRPMRTHVAINSSKDKSTAMCEKITTVEKINAGYFIAHCTDEEMTEISNALVISLDLTKAQNLGIVMKAPTPITAKLTPPPSEDTTALKIELAKARAEANLLKELYQNLLQQQLQQ